MKKKSRVILSFQTIVLMLCVMVMPLLPTIRVKAAPGNGTAVTLPHTHVGNTSSGGACYTPVYHTHSGSSGTYGGCYQGARSESSYTCNQAFTSTTGPFADGSYNHFCKYSHITNTSQSWITGTCQQKITSYSYALSCGKTTSTIESYKSNCSYTDCGTAYITCSDTTANISTAQLTCTIASANAGATAVNWNWSTGETTQSINIVSNGIYSCELTYQDSKSGNQGTVTVSYTADNLDGIPPVVSVSVNKISTTNEGVLATISATDNVGVTGYSFDGTTFSSSKSKLFTENGTVTGYATDVGGNIGSASVTISNIDMLAPAVNAFSLSTDDPTNQPVLISADCSERYSSGYDTSNGTALYYKWNDNTYSSVFTPLSVTANGTYILYLKDYAGNVSENPITVGNYDNILPVMSSISEDITIPTNHDIVLTVNANDSQPDGYNATKGMEYSINGRDYQSSKSFTVTENGIYTLFCRDLAGNMVNKTIQVSNIDKTAPTMTYEITPDAATNGEVTITVTAQDEYGILKIASDSSSTDGSSTGSVKSLQHSIAVSANGTYHFTAFDISGNKKDIDIIISNIDTEKPQIVAIVYDADTPTNDLDISVSAQDRFSSGYDESYGTGVLYSIDGGDYTSETTLYVNSNGSHEVSVKDTAGNISTQTISVSNFDDVQPVVDEIQCSTYAATKDNITVTVTAHDEQPTGYGAETKLYYSLDNSTYSETGEFEISANGSYTVYVKDAAGNIQNEEFTIGMIDRECPVIKSAMLGTQEPINRDVKVTVYAQDQYSDGYDESYGTHLQYKLNGMPYVTDNEFNISENGNYTVAVKDSAGNESSYDFVVGNIDNIAPTLTLQLSNEKMTSDSIYIIADAADQQPEGYCGTVGLTYSMDDMSYVSENQFKITENGIYTVYAKDAAGNVASESITVENIITAGISSKDIHVSINNGTWTNQSVILSVSVNSDLIADGGYLSFDNGITWTDNKEYTVSQNGIVKILIKDQAGNITVYNYSVSNIDKAAPEISLTTSSNYENGKTTIIVIAHDGLSGLPVLAYSWDNGKTWTSHNSLDVTETGLYTVTVRDVAGNIASKSVEITATQMLLYNNGSDLSGIELYDIGETETSESTTKITYIEPEIAEIEDIPDAIELEPVQDREDSDTVYLVPDHNNSDTVVKSIVTTGATATSVLACFAIMFSYITVPVFGIEDEEGKYKYIGRARLRKKFDKFVVSIPKRIVAKSFASNYKIVFSNGMAKRNTGKELSVTIGDSKITKVVNKDVYINL